MAEHKSGHQIEMTAEEFYAHALALRQALPPPFMPTTLKTLAGHPVAFPPAAEAFNLYDPEHVQAYVAANTPWLSPHKEH